MTEQSEHLSNAQIENYGIRTSGAGPDAAQRDEPQRANHQSIDDQRISDQPINDQPINDQSISDRQISDQPINDPPINDQSLSDRQISDRQISDRQIDDQRVESHLADCAPCRNRLLGFHRSLFTGVADSPEADPSGKDTAPSGHSPSDQGSADSKLQRARSTDSGLEGARPPGSALADSNFANPNDPVDPQVRTAPTPACPSTDALRELAAGLTPDDLAPALTRHAATCDHCGPLLRTYTEIFSDDFTPEEQAALANLQSASAEWQRNTAREMMEAAGVQATAAPSTDGQSSLRKSSAKPTTDRKPFFWKWALVPAIAVVVVLAAITFPIYLARRDTPEKVEKLLAQAFTEQRPMEIRWPGAAWSQYSAQRGTMVEAKSTSLMRAEIAVEHQTEKALQEIGWIRVAAETQIIAGHPQNAIPDLEQALRSDPSSVPLLLDLAIAYLGQGEQTHNQESYEKSRDLLSSVLQREPADTVALFNRALVYERLNTKDKAAADWKTFLKTEKDVYWLAEAQKKLTDLSE